MKVFGRTRILCSKKLNCGVIDSFVVVVESNRLNEAKSKYQSMGYYVSVA